MPEEQLAQERQAPLQFDRVHAAQLVGADPLRGAEGLGEDALDGRTLGAPQPVDELVARGHAAA
ncbi:MAG: hypothetical protein ACKOTD_04025, partial [Phycisphaerales bacterium]